MFYCFADGSQERTVCLQVDGEQTELSCEDPNDSSYEVCDNIWYFIPSKV